mgnify:FL=1
MAYFPFMIEVNNKKCLVVGGGKIALHKVKKLLPFGVEITVVAEQVCDVLSVYASQIQIVNRAFRDSDIEGMDFVVAATDSEERNHHVAELCKARNILVNAVDMKEDCSFIFPAMVKQDDLVVAISTGGQSPVAAAHLKQTIQNEIPDYYGTLLANMGACREQVLSKVDSEERRKEIFAYLLQYGLEHEGVIPEEQVMNEIGMQE